MGRRSSGLIGFVTLGIGITVAFFYSLGKMWVGWRAKVALIRRGFLSLFSFFPILN